MKIQKRFPQFQVSSFKFQGRLGVRNEGPNADGIVGGGFGPGRGCSASNLKLKTCNSHESGIALVITLILLSIITFMTVTFMVISQHAKNQVSATTQQLVAQQAAQAALDQAEARILAQMISQTNGFNFGPVVSENFQSPFFDTSQPAGTVSVTNVNYYDVNGLPLTGNAYLEMLNNQLVLPRPPVFVTFTNTAAPDSRFYLDLNRNRTNDPSWSLPAVDQFGITNYYPGEPEWIGILQHPDQPHSRSNLYIARYAFFAQPIGNSLDINFIHNQAKQAARGLGQPPGDPTLDGFLRNQGVGSWEINLAAFLNGLNPNYWDYAYQATNNAGLVSQSPSAGQAFTDANGILQFRYGGNYQTLERIYPAAANLLLSPSNQIDYYDFGQLMTNYVPTAPTQDNPAYPWSGSDNTNHLFTLQDLFDPQNVPNPPIGVMNSFSSDLRKAGFGNIPPLVYGDSNFNRFTFSRMASQIGMESAPEPTNKLHLNYKNVEGFAATNFVSWADTDPTQATNALMFFTNAADRLLGSHTNFVVDLNGYVTNLSSSFIPIYPVNYYTPAVHRMLQLAANIYDATLNKSNTAPFDFDYPSVFRPTFGVTNIAGVKTVFVNGYIEVGTNAYYNIPAISLPEQLSVVLNNPTNINIYSVPWVIGAKKGLPNFNQISMQSFSSISRKAQIVKLGGVYSSQNNRQTNIQYVIGISNLIGVQAWNSYMPAYSRPITISCKDIVSMTFTNEYGLITNVVTNNLGFVGPVMNWPGYPGAPTNVTKPGLVQASFKIPMYTMNTGVPGLTYNPAPGNTNLTTSTIFQQTTGYPLPLFGMSVTNRLQFWILDQASGRVIDYVQLDGMSSQRNLVNELQGNDNFGHGGVWDTNRVLVNSTAYPFEGILAQIAASENNPSPNGWKNPSEPASGAITAQDWANMAYPPPNFTTPGAAVAQFNAFMNPPMPATITNLQMQVPYTPTRTVNIFYTWEANDPLVHYTLSDLSAMATNTRPVTNYVYTNMVLQSISNVNVNYRPWGLTPKLANDDGYSFDISLKDPMITRSDDWRFPTNAFPNIGWLGRVHRGTPWQTVYMKSQPVDLGKWQNWTGNTQSGSADPFLSDALTTQPINDWAIFDLFTTAPNDNATRGQLSINQTNFAAWAAIFGGVIAYTNPANGTLVPLIIDPNPNVNGQALEALVAGINRARTNLARPNYPGPAFTQLGQILSVPELSVNSPFLNTSDPTLTDEAYERLPQQVMSLLRVGSPRYVIYAYGQSLKPADNSLQIGGPYYGTCTNYQITGEMETRTVVTIEPSKPSPLISTNPVENFNNLMFRVLNPTQNPMMPGQPSATQPQPRVVIQNFNVLPPE